MKIALTGGIACGKSLLARYLSSMGVATIDADDVVHELEAPGGADGFAESGHNRFHGGTARSF